MWHRTWPPNNLPNHLGPMHLLILVYQAGRLLNVLQKSPKKVVMKYFHRGNFFGHCFLEEMFQGDIMTFNWRRKHVMNRITWGLEGSWVAFKFANDPSEFSFVALFGDIFFCQATRIQELLSRSARWCSVSREVNKNLGLFANRFSMNGYTP